jgi:hypothetical protein
MDFYKSSVDSKYPGTYVRSSSYTSDLGDIANLAGSVQDGQLVEVSSSVDKIILEDLLKSKDIFLQIKSRLVDKTKSRFLSLISDLLVFDNFSYGIKNSLNSNIPANLEFEDNEINWMTNFLELCEISQDKFNIVICPNDKGIDSSYSWTQDEWINFLNLLNINDFQVTILPHFSKNKRDISIEQYCDNANIICNNLNKYFLQNSEILQESQYLFGNHISDTCSVRQFSTLAHVLSKQNSDTVFVSNDSGPIHLISNSVIKDSEGINISKVISVNLYQNRPWFTPRNGGYAFKRDSYFSKTTSPEKVAKWLNSSYE